MDEIAFKSDWQNREQIAIWIPKESKERYNRLKNEYGVKVSEEVRKLVVAGLERLEEALIKRSTG